MLKIYFSNRIERLYEEFKQQLFDNPLPFEKRIVIVPNPAVKTWLLLQLAKDPQIGIAMGLEILHLDAAIQRLQSLLFPEQEQALFPSHLKLTLLIENQLSSLKKETYWEPVFNYLQLSSEVNPNKVKKD